jgi:hypothetical protein
MVSPPCTSGMMYCLTMILKTMGLSNHGLK